MSQHEQNESQSQKMHVHGCFIHSRSLCVGTSETVWWGGSCKPLILWKFRSLTWLRYQKISNGLCIFLISPNVPVGGYSCWQHKTFWFALPVEDLKTVFIGIIRPMVEYAVQAWFSALFEQQHAALERIQEQTCRIMLRNKDDSYADDL